MYIANLLHYFDDEINVTAFLYDGKQGMRIYVDLEYFIYKSKWMF